MAFGVFAKQIYSNAAFASEVHTNSRIPDRCERLLGMIGLERLQDSALAGRCVTSDLIEVPPHSSRIFDVGLKREHCFVSPLIQPKLFQPDDEFMLHVLLVTKGNSLWFSCQWCCGCFVMDPLLLFGRVACFCLFCATTQYVLC